MSKNIPINEDTDKLFDAVRHLESVEECYAFFDDLCTVAEVNAIVQRFGVARMLDEGLTYAEIEERTGASTATISRINKCLTHGEGGYRLAITKLKAKKDD